MPKEATEKRNLQSVVALQFRKPSEISFISVIDVTEFSDTDKICVN